MDSICCDCGKDLGAFASFIHLTPEGEFCGEGTEEAVSAYVCDVFGINLSKENIDKIAEKMCQKLVETLENLI